MTSLATRTPTFLLEREQLVRRGLDEVFGVFADPANLEALTPDWLHFRILGSSTPTLGAGTTIDYRLRLRGVPLRWRSLISSWRPPFGFVDEQVRGPYRTWVHSHAFLETDRGVVVRDSVRYSVPGGALVDRLLVRPDLERIFDHRQAALATLLPDR